MKTRCINLRDHEVRGLLDGSITALWRPVKLTGHDGIQSDHSQWRFVSTPDSWTGQKDLEKGIYAWQHRADIKRLIQERCPYGQPGDVLIGREAWQPFDWYEHCDCDGACSCPRGPLFRSNGGTEKGWRSAATMPASLSRIHRELVAVECRQGKTGITEAMSVASGAKWTDNGTIYVSQPNPGWSHFGETHPDRCHTSWYGSFGAMIERYYPGAWHADSWFWVLTVKEVAA